MNHRKRFTCSVCFSAYVHDYTLLWFIKDVFVSEKAEKSLENAKYMKLQKSREILL